MIGPSGCGKSTVVRCINRMHEEIPGARAEGERHARRHEHLRRRRRRRRGPPRRSAWSSRSPTRSRRCRSSTTSPPGLQARPGSRAIDVKERVEHSLRGAGLWDEVKDRLDEPGHRPLRRPAAAAVHRAHDRRRARGHPHGRAVLGPRPDRHAEDRGAHRRAQGALHDRHRHAQHAAGRARGRHDGLHARRRAGRARADRADLLQRRTTSAPSSTSPASSGRARATERDADTSRKSSSCSRSRRSAGIDLVLEQLDRVLEALEHQDVELATMVITDDDRIDGRYLEVHQGSSRCSRARRPWRGDLRLVAALLHVIKHVERMGDQCVNIAKLIPLSGHEPPVRDEMLERVAAHGPRGALGGHPGAGRVLRAQRRPGRGPRAPGPRDQPPQPRDLPARHRHRRRPRHARVGHAHDDGRARARAHRRQRRRHRRGQTAFVVTGLFREFSDSSHPSRGSRQAGAVSARRGQPRGWW